MTDLEYRVLSVDGSAANIAARFHTSVDALWELNRRRDNLLHTGRAWQRYVDDQIRALRENGGLRGNRMLVPLAPSRVRGQSFEWREVPVPGRAGMTLPAFCRHMMQQLHRSTGGHEVAIEPMTVWHSPLNRELRERVLAEIQGTASQLDAERGLREVSLPAGQMVWIPAPLYHGPPVAATASETTANTVVLVPAWAQNLERTLHQIDEARAQLDEVHRAVESLNDRVRNELVRVAGALAVVDCLLATAHPVVYQRDALRRCRTKLVAMADALGPQLAQPACAIDEALYHTYVVAIQRVLALTESARLTELARALSADPHHWVRGETLAAMCDRVMGDAYRLIARTPFAYVVMEHAARLIEAAGPPASAAEVIFELLVRFDRPAPDEATVAGLAASVAATTVGNAPGPVSLGVTFTHLYALWKLPAMGRSLAAAGATNGLLGPIADIATHVQTSNRLQAFLCRWGNLTEPQIERWTLALSANTGTNTQRVQLLARSLADSAHTSRLPAATLGLAGALAFYLVLRQRRVARESGEPRDGLLQLSQDLCGLLGSGISGVHAFMGFLSRLDPAAASATGMSAAIGSAIRARTQAWLEGAVATRLGGVAAVAGLVGTALSIADEYNAHGVHRTPVMLGYTLQFAGNTALFLTWLRAARSATALTSAVDATLAQAVGEATIAGAAPLAAETEAVIAAETAAWVPGLNFAALAAILLGTLLVAFPNEVPTYRVVRNLWDDFLQAPGVAELLAAPSNGALRAAAADLTSELEDDGAAFLRFPRHALPEATRLLGAIGFSPAQVEAMAELR